MILVYKDNRFSRAEKLYRYVYIYSVYIYIVCIYIYMYVYIVCFELSGICPNLGGQVAEVTTGAVDTCLGEDDDHSTSGVAARRSWMFGQAGALVKHDRYTLEFKT